MSGRDNDRLGLVARLRKIQEDRARVDLVRAEAQVAAAKQAVADAEEQQAEQIPDAGHTLPPVQLLSLHLRGLASTELLGLAEDEYERTVVRRKEAHRRLQRANRERRSVEKLEQRRHADELAKFRTIAERSLDELMILRQGRSEGDA